MRLVYTRPKLESGDVPTSYHRTVALSGLNLDNRSQLAFLASYIDILKVWQTPRSPMLNPIMEARVSPLAELATATVHRMNENTSILPRRNRQRLARASIFGMLIPSISVLQIVVLANKMLSELTFPTVCSTLISPTCRL